MADALHTFYKEVSDNRGKVSGVPTGEADVDVMLHNVLNMCSICEVAPPDKLVKAVGWRLELYDRRHQPRRGNQSRVHQGKLDRLVSYFFENPKASQRQAAIVTGLDRKTVRKYMALPEWERLLIPKWSSTRSAPH
ncbi:MAG: hypothetical protein O7A62_08720 [Alphaproteobacteria bacterium]|nr:hypothetical protein [Alphaproteobacteria bacterium]